MKFENVQVGDTVFTEKQVSYEWNSAETFYVPEKVTRVTKTQFAVESGDRYKKEGNKIDDSWTKAYFKGDDAGYFGRKKIVDDQTSEMIEFKRKLEVERKFNNLIEKISIPRNSNFNANELNDMITDLEKIQTLIKTKKDEA